MKSKITAYALAAMLFSAPAFAQVVSQDSIQSLNNQKEAIKISKDLNDKKLKLAEKQKDLQDKTGDMQKSAEKAKASADANTRAAAELSSNPQDKKLAGKASSAAKDAQRDAKNARKAADNVDGLTKDIADLQKEIQEKEAEFAAKGGTVTPGVATPGVATPGASTQGVATQAASTSVTAPQISQDQQNSGRQPVSSAYAGAVSNGQVASGMTTTNAPNVMQRNITLDSASANNAEAIAQRVVESTYRNYPQQPGQPAIIINNIIVPSDYNRQAPAPAQPMAGNIPKEDLQDYEDYKEWLRYKRGQPAGQDVRRSAVQDQDQVVSSEPMTKEERLTFRERFGEKPARHSGLWVIPMAGVHASNFNANFQDGKYEGRTGWNAGLDFRFRVRKVFIQPGVHYFSSSMDVTREDDISNAPLLTGSRIHSLKAPLMLGVYLTKPKGGFFRFNIKGGIVGNYVLDVDATSNDRFEKDNIEELSYGLNAGFGIEFGFITLDFSHEWGMSAVFKDVNQKNNILRGTIGFKL